MVEIYLRMGQNSHLVTAIGRVTQVDPDHPNRVKTNNCRKKFHKVLKIITYVIRRLTEFSTTSTILYYVKYTQ